MAQPNRLGPANALFPEQAPTLADGWQYNAQAYQSWLDQQRASGVASGMLDPQTGWPTGNALLDAAKQYSGALMASTATPGIRAYHGSRASGDFAPTVPAGGAFWLSSHPGEAAEMGASIHKGTGDVSTHAFDVDTSGFKDIDHAGRLFDRASNDALVKLSRVQGYPGVVLRNVRNAEDSDPTTSYMVFDKTRLARPIATDPTQ